MNSVFAFIQHSSQLLFSVFVLILCVGSPQIQAQPQDEWVLFEVEEGSRGPELSWIVANITQTDHFVIERFWGEQDGEFQAVAKVKPAASGDRLIYTYRDTGATAYLKRPVFYRIKQVDQNGSFSYSEVAELNMGVNNTLIRKAYPNPFVDKLHVKVQAPNGQITLKDSTGRNIRTYSLQASQQAQHIRMILGDLAAGVYYLEAVEGQQSERIRIVKY